jgi:hypothetical protein
MSVRFVAIEGGLMAPLPPNPVLRELEVFIGDWDVTVPGFPGGPGRATFEWLEGGAFLRFHSAAPEPAPSATLIISRDDSGEAYTAFHYDSRGVSRVYGMGFDGRYWTFWRNAPGFQQRFEALFADDTIDGTWEKAVDGGGWEHDLDFHYTRVR